MEREIYTYDRSNKIATNIRDRPGVSQVHRTPRWISLRDTTPLYHDLGDNWGNSAVY